MLRINSRGAHTSVERRFCVSKSVGAKMSCDVASSATRASLGPCWLRYLKHTHTHTHTHAHILKKTHTGVTRHEHAAGATLCHVLV